MMLFLELIYYLCKHPSRAHSCGARKAPRIPPPPTPSLYSYLCLFRNGTARSRHAEVESRLPKNATIYIVAPHELFVANLIPMTFFLLLLAFTDGTTRTAEVLPRSALMHQAMKNRVRALDTTDVESYVYDSSLPAFQRCDL